MLKLTKKQADRAYVSNNLWLPKRDINQLAVKQALELYPSNQEGDVALPVRLWKETKHHLIVPRDYIPENQRSNYPFKFVSLVPTSFQKTGLQHRITPRDQTQVEAIAALSNSNGGILNLACGKGKTVVALAAMVNKGVPAIVIVNNKGLLSQWRDNIREHLVYDGPIGLVQQNEFDWKHPITLAMIQTLAKRSDTWPADFRRYFGTAIYDEVHHLAAEVFSLSADLFFGTRWGLTATDKRPDGLESIYHYHIGPIIYQDLKQDLIPEVFFIRTGVEPVTKDDERALKDASHQLNISKIRSWLAIQEDRNDLILDEVYRANKAGRKILAVTHSKAHAYELHEKFEGSGLCTGDTPEDERRKVLMENDVTFATIQVAGEAMDAPQLDTLFILTPFGAHNTMQQTIGRTQRQAEGKKRLLVMILQDSIEFCEGLCGKMKQYLRGQKYKFKVINRRQT